MSSVSTQPQFLDGWQDEIIMAIIDADPQAIWDALERSPKSALDCQLQRYIIGGYAFFVFHQRFYITDASRVREVLGTSFAFENEEARTCIADWLTMIGAKKGDTLLHLAMRLNGVDNLVKARCAVEILGRGASYEIENCDGELSSMIDPAFQLAWLKELPAWKKRKAAQGNQVRLNEEADQKAQKRKLDRRKHNEQGRREVEERLARVKEAQRVAREEEQEGQRRLAFHRNLDRMLVKLEKREQRQAIENPAWRELWQDIRQIPLRIELWWQKK